MENSKFSKFKTLNAFEEARQTTKDLSLHATKQLIELMERTTSLVEEDNPVSCVIITHDLALTALMASAAHLMRAAMQEGGPMPLEMAFKISLDHLNKEVINLHKFITKRGGIR
jgi:hypothetical protein